MMNFTDRQFNRIALSGLAIGFLLLVAAFVTSVAVLRGGRVSAEQVRHTYEVVDQLSLLEIQLERAETGRRGYLLSSSAYRVRLYDENIRLAPQSLENLKRLVGDNPLQLERTRKIETLMRDQLSDMRETMDLARSGEVEEARARFSAADRTSFIRAIRGTTAQMRQGEYELLALRSEGEAANLRFMQTVLAITGLLLFLVGAAAFWTVRRYTVDLTSTRDRLHLLNTDLEGEVGRRTADLTRANEEIQRFAYIVSHDLRSPLVNILGFTAELETANGALGGLIERVAQDAPALLSDDVRHAQEDLPEAIGFIRASTQKMDRLINAILRLSREGRRTLTPERLPMEAVLGEIAASLTQRIEDAGASLIIETPIPDMTNDRVAIEQIFSNVIENAIKYGHPDRPTVVRVRGREQDSRLIYEIEDNGRGIDPKDHQRIFDLFRRSGTQDKPGEGIGLAHVRALVTRLGGYIDIESSLGEGSIFRLNLPATYVDQGVTQ